MALQNSISNIPREVFVNYIVEKLRKTNPHLAASFDESKFVLEGAVVHVPQAGNSPKVVKNRNEFPAVAVLRGDSSVTYALDVYSTDPTHIAWHESYEISYDKTDSVLADHVNTLIEAVGDNMLYNWLHGYKKVAGAMVADEIPSTNIIRTSGSLVPVNVEDGQEGTRKAFSHVDLKKAQAMMNKMNVPKEGRFCVVESYMYAQLMDSLSNNMMAAFQQGVDLANGVMGKLYGFSIMERSSVIAFDADLAVKVPEEAIEGTDHISAICWQKDCVTRAQGDIKPFENKDDATYYGDVFSALCKFGGRARREDWKGVIAIVQEGEAEAPALSDEAEILTALVNNANFVSANVVSGASAVTVTMVAGTDVTGLKVIFTLSDGATINPASETLLDYTNPQVMVVTAEDGVTTKQWTVNVVLQA
ncbi:MAG: hypothetical protein RBS07_15815 [Lentimicrobium sp.]|jgi:hypothetical protein|nr:hypothetical protein [Lentimicrobium sp.]